jgi:hypothetical protein
MTAASNGSPPIPEQIRARLARPTEVCAGVSSPVSSSGAGTSAPPNSARASVRLIDQSIDLAALSQVILWAISGDRPANCSSMYFKDAVGVRLVQAPHHHLDADAADQLGVDRIEPERRLGTGGASIRSTSVSSDRRSR